MTPLDHARERRDAVAAASWPAGRARRRVRPSARVSASQRSVARPRAAAERPDPGAALARRSGSCTSRRLSSATPMPSVMPPISSSQFAPDPKPLITIRTTQVPPARASTIHSVASVDGLTRAWSTPPTARSGAAAPSRSTRAVEPHAVAHVVARSVPPSRSSTSAGCIQALMPGPVAIASQTCSGVPGTSTSSSIRSARRRSSVLLGIVWERVRGDHHAVRAPAGAASSW